MGTSSEILAIFVTEIEESIAQLRSKPSAKEQRDLMELIESSSKCIGAKDIYALVEPFTSKKNAKSVVHIGEFTQRLEGRIKLYREALRPKKPTSPKTLKSISK